jgi:hypothetical protein
MMGVPVMWHSLFSTMLCLSSIATVVADSEGQTINKAKLMTVREAEASQILPASLAKFHSAILNPEMRDATYVLKSSDDRLIAGYSLKWTVSQGSESSSYYTFYDESDLLDRPAGTVRGYGLNPQDVRLLNPAFNVGVSDLADDGLISRVNSAGASSKVGAAGVTIGCVLDAVIYSDGGYEGADESQYGLRFVAERDGKHDAAVALLLAHKPGDSKEEMAKDLQAEIAAAEGAPATGGNPFYAAARARWAGNLLTLLNHSGEGPMMRNAERFAQIKPTHIHRD